MAGSYYTRWDAKKRRYVRTRRKKRRKSRATGALAGLGGFGQVSTLKASVSSVKGILITGGIAAGGAIITERVFDRIQEGAVKKGEGLEGYTMIAAKMATGLALALVISKFLKKPGLAAAFAIGPVVSGLIDVINELTEPSVSPTHGLGMMAIDPVPAYDPYSMYAGLGQGDGGTGYEPEWDAGEGQQEFEEPLGALGMQQAGTGVPDWMMQSNPTPYTLAG